LKILIDFKAIWNIYRLFEYRMINWYILCSFGTFFPVLVSCTRKNLATLSRNLQIPTEASSFAQDEKSISITERPSLGQAALELRARHASTQCFSVCLRTISYFVS
jgi:hypothetical protein